MKTNPIQLINSSIARASKLFATIAKNFYLQNYDLEGYNINGFVRWAELTDFTKTIRAKKGYPYPQYKILVNSGKLRSGLQVVPNKSGITIVDNVSYASEQNDTRPFIYVSDVLNNKYVTILENQIVNDLNNMKWI